MRPLRRYGLTPEVVRAIRRIGRLVRLERVAHRPARFGGDAIRAVARVARRALGALVDQASRMRDLIAEQRTAPASLLRIEQIHRQGPEAERDEGSHDAFTSFAGLRLPAMAPRTAASSESSSAPNVIHAALVACGFTSSAFCCSAPLDFAFSMSWAMPCFASAAACVGLSRLFSTRCAVSLRLACTSLVSTPVAAAICCAVFGSFSRWII